MWNNLDHEGRVGEIPFDRGEGEEMSNLKNLRKCIDLFVMVCGLSERDQLEFLQESFRILRVRATEKDVEMMEEELKRILESGGIREDRR